MPIDRTADRTGARSPASRAPLIRAHGLGYRYPSAPRLALRGVTFQVERGTVLGLVGPNGSGKTTLYRLLLGFVRPQLGGVTIAGLEPAAYRRSRGIGYLPEQVNLPATIRVREFAILMARLAGLRRDEIRAASDRLMATLSLREKENIAIGVLSHGYRQRVGLLAALLGEPELLLLDEPANGLDPISVGILRSVLRRLRRRGRTVIVSSHNLAELERVCDQVLILSQGRVLGLGERAALDRRPDIWVVRLGEERTAAGTADALSSVATPGGVRLAVDEVAFADAAAARTFARRMEAAGVVVEAIDRRRYDLEYLFHSLIRREGREAEG